MISTPERFTYSFDYRKIEYGDKPGDGLSVKALQKILHERMIESEGEACDLHCHQTAQEKASRYVENLQSLMHNAFGITLKVYYEAEFEQEGR